MKHIGRKLYHMGGGIALLSLYYILGRERALVVYALLFCLVLAADVVRLRVPAVNRFIFTKFNSFIRKNEEHKLTGTPSYVLGIGLSLFLFPAPFATAAICFLAFGDVAATTVGEHFGRTRIGNKSLEGTAAFVAAATCAGLLLSPLGIPVAAGIVVAGAIAAAGIELLPVPINDNLMIPVGSAGIMTLIARLIVA